MKTSPPSPKKTQPHRYASIEAYVAAYLRQHGAESPEQRDTHPPVQERNDD
jgi:hypothetical protein